VERSRRSGVVEVRWQADASMMSPWLGVDGTEDGPGFIVLRNAVASAPASVDGAYLRQCPKVLRAIQRDIQCPAMVRQLKAEGLEDSVPWLLECANTGQIPIFKSIEDVAPPGALGRKVEIGTPSRHAVVLAMDNQPPATAAEFFKLPRELLTTMQASRNLEHGNNPQALFPLPNVRQDPFKDPADRQKRKAKAKKAAAPEKAKKRSKSKAQKRKAEAKADAPEEAQKRKKKAGPPNKARTTHRTLLMGWGWFVEGRARFQAVRKEFLRFWRTKSLMLDNQEAHLILTDSIAELCLCYLRPARQFKCYLRPARAPPRSPAQPSAPDQLKTGAPDLLRRR
jgi:hypothetical protein